MSWMRLPQEYSGHDSFFVVLPVSYEKNVTFGAGASKGPAAIIAASEHLEYYDERFDAEPFVKGIRELPTLSLSGSSPEQMVSIVSGVVADQLGRFVIALGGDHAVTLGAVAGVESLHEEFSVVVFDAHADFRDSWNGSSLNHACVSKQLSKKHDVLLVGVRSMDRDEAEQFRDSKHVHVVKAYEDLVERVKEFLPLLKEKVYVSIDVDVFDFIRNTGTPEPGGLSWEQLMACLEIIFRSKSVVGADVVEFAPSFASEAESYALAKLAHVMMALKARSAR